MASNGSQKVAVEVETGDSDIRRNIEADLKAGQLPRGSAGARLKAGFSYVLSVPTNPCAERKTSELVARERYGDKVRVVPARMLKIKARPA